jgi:TolB protein
MKRLGVWIVGGIVGFLLAAVGCEPAGAQVRGTIFGPGLRNYPVAISPLAPKDGKGGGADVGTQFADIVTRDLTLSGQFRTIDREAYIEGPETYTVDTINFPNWSVIGALALAKGWLSLEGDRLTVEVRLFDVYQRRQIVGRRYSGSVSEMRRMAHRFADEIMAQLTGARGPFDSRIAFASTRGGRFKELYVMSLDGGDVRQLTNNRTINISPSWAPRGSVLLYTSYKRRQPALFSLDLVTGADKPLWSQSGLNLGGRFSPDGSTIALAVEKDGNTDIILLSADGELRRKFSDSWAIDVSPSWSPDGNQIAFCSDRAGGPQIYIQNVDGGEARRVTFKGNYNTSPAWSPDGTRIAYVSRTEGVFNIFTTDLNGGEVRQLTQGAGRNEDPSWSPDSRYIVFSSSRSGGKKLFIVDAATGTSQVQLTAGDGDDSSPTWSGWLQ